MKIEAKWIEDGLRALEREAEDRLSGNTLKGARLGIAELRAIRDPLARLGQPAVKSVLTLVGQDKDEDTIREAFAFYRSLSFDERRAVKAGANVQARMAREQYDADVEAFLEAMKAIGKVALSVVIPMLLAAI